MNGSQLAFASGQESQASILLEYVYIWPFMFGFACVLKDLWRENDFAASEYHKAPSFARARDLRANFRVAAVQLDFIAVINYIGWETWQVTGSRKRKYGKKEVRPPYFGLRTTLTGHRSSLPGAGASRTSATSVPPAR